MLTLTDNINFTGKRNYMLLKALQNFYNIYAIYVGNVRMTFTTS